MSRITLLNKLKAVASVLNAPLYVVGGAARDYLAKGELSDDVDLAAPVDEDVFNAALLKESIVSKCTYRRTHTVQFEYEGIKCEFTSFRKERYSDGGGHTPEFTEPTDDIIEDARRRDFKCNAVYYDVVKGEFVDVLGGIGDIKNRVIDTVKNPDDVFKSDGLRLMRLARFAGELGFTPLDRVIAAAKRYADNIKDISPERIFAELEAITVAETKHAFSPSDGFFRAVCVLRDIGVINRIFPYFSDVALSTCRYSYEGKSVRIAAMLVGENDGVSKRLLNLKAPKKVAVRAERLVEALPLFEDFTYNVHDENNRKRMDEAKVFVADNVDILDDLIELKKAYRKAVSKNDLTGAELLESIYVGLTAKNAPLTLKDLAVDGVKVAALGIKGANIGKALNALRIAVLTDAAENTEPSLIEYLTARKEEFL